MKSRKVLTKLLVTAFIFMLLSTFITVNVSAEPYVDNLIVPDNKSIIVATDFDSGVYKKAPADGSKDIRPDEEVNTEIGGSDFGGNIGWIAKGDWVQYTVYVEQDGIYRIQAWLASDADPTGAVKLYYNDQEVGTSEKSAKEGWQEYSLYFIADVEMAAGKCVLKTEFTGGLNISALEIIPLGANGNPIWIPVEHKISSAGKNIIKAVDFDPKVYNKAPVDGSKDIRPDEEVNTELSDNEFGSNIGYITAGDWVQYTVKVQRDGKYEFEAWLASDADPTGAVKIYCDDKEVGTSPNSDKNGWQAYDVYPVGETEITAGDHIIKVEFTGGVNFSAFKMTRTGDIGGTQETSADEKVGSDDASTAQTDAKTGESDGNGMMVIILLIVGVAIVVAAVVVAAVKNSKKSKRR